MLELFFQVIYLLIMFNFKGNKIHINGYVAQKVDLSGNPKGDLSDNGM